MTRSKAVAFFFILAILFLLAMLSAVLCTFHWEISAVKLTWYLGACIIGCLMSFAAADSTSCGNLFGGLPHRECDHNCTCKD